MHRNSAQSLKESIRLWWVVHAGWEYRSGEVGEESTYLCCGCQFGDWNANDAIHKFDASPRQTLGNQSIPIDPGCMAAGAATNTTCII